MNKNDLFDLSALVIAADILLSRNEVERQKIRAKSTPAEQKRERPYLNKFYGHLN